MLQFADLDQVFPNWVIPSNSYNRVRELVDILFVLDSIKSPLIKENIKVRVVNGKLQLDNRSFKFICRKISGDSRWKVLKIIDGLVKQYGMHTDIIKFVKIIYLGCYKNDSKWKKALYEFIPERYLVDTFYQGFAPMSVSIPSSSRDIINNESIPTRISDRDVTIMFLNEEPKKVSSFKSEDQPPSYDFKDNKSS